MASGSYPSRLLRQTDKSFSVIKPEPHAHHEFDIVSYTWGKAAAEYDCGIPGVSWLVTISPQKLEDIKRFMIEAEVEYLWVDCVCIHQADDSEKSSEIAKMHEYYKSASTCHILLEVERVWEPQEIVDDLKFVDHILAHMKGAALASEAMLTEVLLSRLTTWKDMPWTFAVDKAIARSAAIELGVLNCYSTCIRHVQSLFHNPYFYRVWTFQEMLLGKNVTMWAKDQTSDFTRIGALDTWMDLATESRDKAEKLFDWINFSRRLKTESVFAVLGTIADDKLLLDGLEIVVKGINSARMDIINGGPYWWRENHEGIKNIFSAISILPRKCKHKADLFRGLLGVFNGLFTPEEIETKLSGSDINELSFSFFKQLSIRTGNAWTKLAVSSRERGEWDWIPVIPEQESGKAVEQGAEDVADQKTKEDDTLTTDCFAGVTHLGRVKPNGLAKAFAITGVKGTPREYMKITLIRGDEPTGFRFSFKGCNCGKKMRTGFLRSKSIPTYQEPTRVVRDDTGRILVQCATILGAAMDPGSSLVGYRKRLLINLKPNWHVSDPNAKPIKWYDRCVSGTAWDMPEHANGSYLRAHNMSMNYHMDDIIDCESRLQNETTSKVLCKIRVNCGCTMIGPFSFMFGAITAVHGSFLGETAISKDKDDRLILQDGLGLLQVGNKDATFSMIAFGGDLNWHKLHAAECRKTRENRPVVVDASFPTGRGLVRQDFGHSFTDAMRDYGFVRSGGSGNLLICRNHILDPYRVIGVCIDDWIETKKEGQEYQKVTIK